MSETKYNNSLLMENYSSIFPQLSRVTLLVLSISVSSAATECVFSETGCILEARRQQQLSPDSLDSQIFLHNFPSP